MTIKVIVVACSLPQFPILSTKAITSEPSTWVIIDRVESKDDFANLALYQALFCLPTVNKNERLLMKAIVGRRFSIKEADLKVVRLLKKILTILSNISMISYESYNHQLVLKLNDL